MVSFINTQWQMKSFVNFGTGRLTVWKFFVRCDNPNRPKYYSEPLLLHRVTSWYDHVTSSYLVMS